MAGDFSSFYEENYDDIYRYVYCKIGNPWDTDDIVSEVFTRAYRHFATAPGHRKAWLVTIARNTSIDFFRRQGREIPAAVPENLAFIPEADSCELDPDMACLKSSLSHLRPEQFELVNLRYFCDLPMRDIARVLGITTGAVKMRIYRLLEYIGEKVKQCLEEKKI